MAPIDTLLGLLDELDRLDQRQAAVRFVRNSFPDDQEVQLEADRTQTEIDRARIEIENIMAYIANSN